MRGSHGLDHVSRRLRKFLVALLTIAAVIVGCVLLFRGTIARVLVERALAMARTVAADHGIAIESVRFADARLVGPGAIACDAVFGQVRLARDTAGVLPGRVFVFGADHVRIDAGWPWSSHARVEIAEGFLQSAEAAESGAKESVLDGIEMQVELPFSWRKPRKVLASVETEARRLLGEACTSLPLTLSATAAFTVGSHRHELPMQSEPEPSGGARIVLDRAAIEEVSRHYLNPLTATEIDLVARHPHRAAALLRISEQAQRAASALRRRDRSFPYDAYRHIYWSWLLTRRFGPDFSEQVTDAHEIGATYESGEDNRRMDQHNNALGRAWAMAGVPESELLERVLTDPAVMREP